MNNKNARIPQTPDYKHPKVMIYVVDDDYDVRRSLRFLLETEGFEVRAFSSASSLLDFDLRGEADCLIIDYKMNPIDGLELTQRLRDLKINAPVILITGFPDESIPAKAEAAGVYNVLTKPHLDESITANVREALNLSV